MERLVREHADDFACLFEAAQYYARKCDYDRAVALYERSFEAEPRRPRFTDELTAIADIWEIRGEYKKAAETYERVIALLENEWGMTEEVALKDAQREKARLLEKCRKFIIVNLAFSSSAGYSVGGTFSEVPLFSRSRERTPVMDERKTLLNYIGPGPWRALVCVLLLAATLLCAFYTPPTVAFEPVYPPPIPSDAPAFAETEEEGALVYLTTIAASATRSARARTESSITPRRISTTTSASSA